MIFNHHERARAVVRQPDDHALCAQAMGFSFSDGVVAARAALERSRALIPDRDVHHGNGVRDLTLNDDGVLLTLNNDGVLYASSHRWVNGFQPGARAASDVDAEGTSTNPARVVTARAVAPPIFPLTPFTVTCVTLSPPLDARASATRARAPPRRVRIVARVFSARRVATDASADEDACEDIERARTRCGGAECGARARVALARASSGGESVTHVMVNGVSGKMGGATARAVTTRAGFVLVPSASTSLAARAPG